MTLLEIVRTLNTLDDESTIYADEPWTETSEALLVTNASANDRIDYCRPDGKSYFIEISVAKEVIEDFANSQPEASIEEVCSRLIYYAIYDA